MIHFILSGLERGWVSDAEFKTVFGESFDKRFKSHFRSLNAADAVKRKKNSWFLTDNPRAIFLCYKAFDEPDIAEKIRRRRL